MDALETDLLVVGAGPAGCAAAVAARAAEPGVRVTVIDAARFPRDKPCAGCLTGGGLRELELAGLALRVPHVVATHALLRADGQSRRVELPHPAVVVRRLELDADLVAQARAAGAVVLEERALVGLDGAVAETPAGPIRFRALVAADGVGGASRRALALPPGERAPLRELHAAAARQWDLLFDLDAGVPGYAWRFPCLEGGRPAETCGVYALQGGGALDAALARFVRREELAGGAAVGYALRLYQPGAPVGAGRALLAGDALGGDPLLGEGLRYALWSGRIAGDLAARAAARGRAPSVARYRAALLATRSGLLLELLARLAPRLYGPEPRWRRAALDARVAAALAALVSGEAPARAMLDLARRLPEFARAAPPA
jgi:flavin-dependent dehydrogenase